MANSKEIRNSKLREVMLHNHPTPRSVSMEEKLSIINQIFELTALDPSQGTKEWVSERQIGGSDTSSVLGKGYFGKSFFEVVKEKIFPGGGFSGNLATRFGRVMEEFSRKMIEKLFSTEVWEFKSLPNQLQYTSYSPDGVTVAQVFGKLMMLLLEFKTPLSRIPDGKIPKEYLPQIKAGMCAIPMVEGSLFINTMLRICGMKDLAYNFNYNTRVHKSDVSTCKSRPITHKSKLNQMVAFGMCLLIQTEPQRKAAEKSFCEISELDPLLADLGLTDGKFCQSYDRNFIVYDSGPSLEDELFKAPRPSALKTIDYVYESSNNKHSLYSILEKKYPAIRIPEGIHQYETKDTEDELFKKSVMYDYEKDYGNETETTIDAILSYADQGTYIGAYHIPPYIITDVLAKSQFFRECGLESSSKPIDPDFITADARVYFIEAINFLRRELEKQSVYIVGFIPYKVFKMDFIFQPNDDPLFMKNQLGPHINIYAEIKSQCNEIDNDANLNDEEKNKKKWEIVFRFFPDKKPADYQEREEVSKGLLSQLDADDFVF